MHLDRKDLVRLHQHEINLTCVKVAVRRRAGLGAGLGLPPTLAFPGEWCLECRSKGPNLTKCTPAGYVARPCVIITFRT
jgi:hypothetical protein